MRIQHNIMAMNAYRNYTNNVSAMQKNLEKLSSGYKINRAGDDAAGLAISEKMRAQITGLETAQKNAKDGISLVQTAEGALTEVHDMLNRMAALATQSANGTYDDTTDRVQMQKEVNQLLDEINRIADSANFNGIKLLDGSLGLNKTAFELTQLTDTAATDVTSDIVGNIPAATGAANVVTKLHTASTSGVKGEFTINLDQVNVTAASSGSTSNFKIKVGNATIVVNATDTATAISASKAASQVLAATSSNNGSGAGFFYVKANGSYGFAKTASSAAAAAGAKGLVYTGAASGNYGVKYSLTGYVNANGTDVVTANATALTDANVASGAFINLNFDVELAAGTKGTLTGNAGHVGTKPINSVMQKDGQMGSTEMTFDVTKLENGMTIEINGIKKTVKVTEDGPSSAGIDLSKLDKNASDYAEQAMAKIVAAFNGAVAGVDVGVNDSGNLTLAEQKGAATSVTKLMEKESTFQAMVKVTKPAVSAGSSIKVTDPSSINEGDTLSITNGGQTTKYVFTKDASKTGTPPAGGVYVNIANLATATAVANALKTAVGAGTTNGGTLTLTGDYSTLGRGLTLQIGDTSDNFNQLNVAVQDCHTASLGVGGLDISSETTAQAAIARIKAAINTVSDVRGTLGATQNRLDHTINNLSVMTENIQDAESTIRDVDVAEEMMAYTKNNILIQSAQAMLAQANQVPQGVLQLLQ